MRKFPFFSTYIISITFSRVRIYRLRATLGSPLDQMSLDPSLVVRLFSGRKCRLITPTFPGSSPHEAVTKTFAFESSIRLASSFDAKPPNTTQWIAPIRAHAYIATTACNDQDIVGEYLLYNWLTHFFYKQLHFRPPEPQIFENRSNLASNCRASNRKFLATFELRNRDS